MTQTLFMLQRKLSQEFSLWLVLDTTHFPVGDPLSIKESINFLNNCYMIDMHLSVVKLNWSPSIKNEISRWAGEYRFVNLWNWHSRKDLNWILRFMKIDCNLKYWFHLNCAQFFYFFPLFIFNCIEIMSCAWPHCIPFMYVDINLIWLLSSLAETLSNWWLKITSDARWQLQECK